MENIMNYQSALFNEINNLSENNISQTEPQNFVNHFQQSSQNQISQSFQSPLLQDIKKDQALTDESWLKWATRISTGALASAVEGGIESLPRPERDIDTDTLSFLNEKFKNPKLAKALEARREYEKESPASRIRKGLNEATGGYTEPKTPNEKFFQDFTKLAAMMRAGKFIFPSTIIGNRNPVNAIYQDLVVPLIGQTTLEATGSNAASLVAMFIASLYNRGAMNQTMQQGLQNAYDNIENQIPHGSNINLGNFAAQFINTPVFTILMNSLENTPSLQPLRQTLTNILNGIRNNNGQVSTQQALEWTRNINETRNNLGSFNFKKLQLRTARENLDALYNSLRNQVYQELEIINPGSGNALREISQAQAVMSRSRWLLNAIENYIGPIKSELVKGMLGGSIGFGLGTGTIPTASQFIKGAINTLTSPTTWGTVGLLKGSHDVIQAAYRYVNSPQLRHMMHQIILEVGRQNTGAVNNLSRQNTGAVNNLIRQLDKEADKEENSHSK